MPAVGDQISPSGRRAYVEQSLTPGRILFLDCSFTNPPKPKYLVLASYDEPPLLLVINSHIHGFIANQPELLVCQVLLSAADYPCLDHDSYVNCAEVFDCVSGHEISGPVMSDLNRIKDELTGADKRAVAAAVIGAVTVSEGHKETVQKGLLSAN